MRHKCKGYQNQGKRTKTIIRHLFMLPTTFKIFPEIIFQICCSPFGKSLWGSPQKLSFHWIVQVDWQRFCSIWSFWHNPIFIGAGDWHRQTNTWASCGFSVGQWQKGPYPRTHTGWRSLNLLGIEPWFSHVPGLTNPDIQPLEILLGATSKKNVGDHKGHETVKNVSSGLKTYSSPLPTFTLMFKAT